MSRIALTLFILLLPVGLIAQEAIAEPAPDFMEAFQTLAGLAALVVLATEGLKKIVKEVLKYVLDGWPTAVLAFVVAEAVALAGAFFDLGMFGTPDFSPYSDLMTGGIVGLLLWFVSKGIFSTAVADFLLTLMKIRVPGPTGEVPPKPPNP